MIDFFGWKSKEKADLIEADNNSLKRTIREMDQKIFTMGQQPSWEMMRPYYQQLQLDTERRMKEENSRITNMLIPEITKAYT